MTLTIDSKVKLNNGVLIPVIGLGTWQSYGKDVKNSVKWALELGYRHIDTAFFYDNEKEIGEAIRESGINRDDIFITTKLWNDMHGYEKTLKAIDRSLKNLGLSYVDLYLIHWPVSKTRTETWKTMEKICKEGKARAIGVSNFTIRHIKELLPHVDIMPVVNQVEFTPFLYQKELLDFCESYKIKIEAYSPLTRGQKFNEPLLIELSHKYKRSIAQILIRWGLQQNLIELPKSIHYDRISENSKVFDFEISNEDMIALNNLNENFRVTVWNPESDMWS